jgi:Fe2+ or Zn2+ uptake regulation protein
MKKQSTTKQILNILNTQGGKKPKQLIAITKASSASVYNALHQLRNKKMIAKEDDGVYITQALKMPLYKEKAVSKVTNKDNWKAVSVSTSNVSVQNLKKENYQLTEWTQMWKRKCERLESDYTQAKIMYLDSQAVIKYLEEKVAQLIKG